MVDRGGGGEGEGTGEGDGDGMGEGVVEFWAWAPKTPSSSIEARNMMLFIILLRVRGIR